MKFLSIAIVSTLVATLSVSAGQSPNECSSNQFFHRSPRTGDCCLNEGGQQNPPSPPNGKSCPNQWNWHSGFGCCVPQNRNHGTDRNCPGDGQWNHDDQCCNHPTRPGQPTPSGGYNNHHKRTEAKAANKVASRNWRAKTMSCAAGQTICNVSNGLSAGANTYACVDTQKDVNFCGGCGSNGESGMDCSAIPNSWNVGCYAGACQVYTCEPGFRVSRDGKGCVALD